MPGQKIRRQYFNIPIYFILSVDAALLALWAGLGFQNPEITLTYWLKISGILLLVSAGLLLPLGMLSVLNRFCFGKIICVLDKKGLHHDGGFVCWGDIKKAVYEPDFPCKVGRRIHCCNQLCLTVKPFKKEIQIELDGAPFMTLREVKRRCPNSKCKISGWGIFLIATIALAPAVLFFVSVMVD